MPTSPSGKADSSKNKPDFGDEVNAEIAQIKNDIAALANTLTTFGRDRIRALPDIASKSTEQTLESARHALDEIRREIASVEHNVERRVADHPAQSLMIAAGLGFLVAFLVRR